MGLEAQGHMIINDPLATACLYLQLNKKKDENHAIRKLLAALADFENAEPIKDVILFQGDLGQLTAALLNARRDGQYTDEEWHTAVTF